MGEEQLVQPVVVLPGRPLDLATQIEQHQGALKVPEVARLLGFKRSGTYQMVSAGRILHYKIGDSIRFDPATPAAWLREHELKVAA
jgi:excisionase family DNA binding protein